MAIYSRSSGKANVLLNLIKVKDNNDLIYNIYLYIQNLSKPKYQFLIQKLEGAGIKHLNGPKILIVFDYVIADINTK